jgi:hypothetical protein
MIGKKVMVVNVCEWLAAKRERDDKAVIAGRSAAQHIAGGAIATASEPTPAT